MKAAGWGDGGKDRKKKNRVPISQHKDKARNWKKRKKKVGWGETNALPYRRDSPNQSGWSGTLRGSGRSRRGRGEAAAPAGSAGAEPGLRVRRFPPRGSRPSPAVSSGPWSTGTGFQRSQPLRTAVSWKARGEQERRRRALRTDRPAGSAGPAPLSSHPIPRPIGSGAGTASLLASFTPFFSSSRSATATSLPHRPKSRRSGPSSNPGRQREPWEEPWDEPCIPR